MRTLIQAFKTKELRNKIFFVLGMIIIYRIGSFIPTPGVDVKVVQQMLGHASATMTMDTYGHLFEDRLDEISDAMDAATKER